MDPEPSPNNQLHPVGDPVEVSVNRTVSGAVPEVTLGMKLATGRPDGGVVGTVVGTVVGGTVTGAVTVIMVDWVEMLSPLSFVTSRATGKVPAAE